MPKIHFIHLKVDVFHALLKNNHIFVFQTYAKFNNIPLKIRATNNPFRSPNGQLPVFRYKNNSLSRVDSVLEVFSQHKYTSDITKLQSSEVTAFSIMLEECIYPALQYLWYD